MRFRSRNIFEGREFALEGLMTRGELRMLAIFDKPDPLEGPFFEETIYVTPSREPRHATGNRRDQRAEPRGARLTPRPDPRRDAGQRGRCLHAGNRRAAHRRPLRPGASSAFRTGGAATLEELVILHAIGEMPAELVARIAVLPAS